MPKPRFADSLPGRKRAAFSRQSGDKTIETRCDFCIAGEIAIKNW
jgi:hypothetical protein